MRPQSSCYPFLSLSFLLCKMGSLTPNFMAVVRTNEASGMRSLEAQ